MSQTKEEKRQPQLSARQFSQIRERMNWLCKSINASGSNGRIPELVEAIEEMFQSMGVLESIYWDDVSLRKSLGIH
jgi:hypothetical protein